MLLEKKIERIILSRPAVEAGERLGFLPGDMKEKVDPYLRPLYDALYELFGADKIDKKKMKDFDLRKYLAENKLSKHKLEKIFIQDFENAIKEMAVRGAPLIGATAAFGIARQMLRDPSNKNLDLSWDRLNQTRPTAINLKWALDRCRNHLLNTHLNDRGHEAMRLALEISTEDVEINKKIGLNGLDIIKSTQN